MDYVCLPYLHFSSTHPGSKMSQPNFKNTIYSLYEIFTLNLAQKNISMINNQISNKNGIVAFSNTMHYNYVVCHIMIIEEMV
jgi:hypothetical protein